MTKTISAFKARTNLGELLNEVYYKHDTIVIEKSGRPVAKLVPLKENVAKRDLKTFLSFSGMLDAKAAEDMKKAIREARKRKTRSVNL